MKTLIRPALTLFVLLSVVTGIVYPLAVTGIARVAFPQQAAGSLLRNASGQAVGSSLIGQNFSDPGHFWGRPSATSPMPYNAANSSGSNQGPLNPALVDAVKGRVEALKAADPGNTAPVPVDLVTASASGLDPHLSPAGIEYQLPRVARAARWWRATGWACPGEPRARAGPEPARCAGARGAARAGGAAHRRPHAGPAGRAARQRAGPEPGARRDAPPLMRRYAGAATRP